jgi:hypothetical protein
MKHTNEDVETLAELAMEVEVSDPIDWGMLRIDEHTAYKIMAANVLEMYDETDTLTLLATVTKLVVENFTLQLKLMELQTPQI